MTIESGAWFGDQSQPKDLPNTPIRVVCGYPERIGKHFRHSGDAWPLMWSIVHELGLTAGMPMGGSGMGDAHNISNVLMDTLDAGVYDLKDEIK
ncbi:MAG: hypothetical protein KAS32_10890, partial [Candidatus Peribacteraceae bacterium]|nr:hypothetical protein [Candidatus Peribacteraceae bacterium]